LKRFHHQLRKVSIHDGSIFNTSLGANPQLSIYAFTARAATRLSTALAKAWRGGYGSARRPI
jgi:choline dehydrogenase-like flavoprotein